MGGHRGCLLTQGRGCLPSVTPEAAPEPNIPPVPGLSRSGLRRRFRGRGLHRPAQLIKAVVVEAERMIVDEQAIIGETELAGSDEHQTSHGISLLSRAGEAFAL